ncbi:arginase family protein [Lentibacillus salinarum]|uniref:Arginase family protein n=1 Tax=Lentibacillus salinarum TaxID=446820 RepID=A0ABW3ZXW8_9BACI
MRGLIDHHTDTISSPSDSLISCGSWVLDSLQDLPMLKKVFIIGVSKEALQHIPASISKNIVTYTENSLQSNFTIIIQSISQNIPTDSVYISMDKGVLDRKNALTGWDHGTLRLKQMMKMMKALFQNENVSGVDVCGDYPVNPTNDYESQDKGAIEKNNCAKGYTIECLKKWTHYKFSVLLNAL